jgi:hypothetical protein
LPGFASAGFGGTSNHPFNSCERIAVAAVGSYRPVLAPHSGPERGAQLEAVVDTEPVHQGAQHIGHGTGADPEPMRGTHVGVTRQQKRDESELVLIEHKAL